MSLPAPTPYKCNFSILHFDSDYELRVDVLAALDVSLSEMKVPFEIAKAIRFIVFNYSPLFSPKIEIKITYWDNKAVYLVNSSTTSLEFINGCVYIGRPTFVNINAGLAIFARKKYSQALWIYDQTQVSQFGIAR